MNNKIYLDNNATTQLSPHVKQNLHEIIEEDIVNPESAHSEGERARRYVTKARALIAESINAEESQIIFTGSGSESNSQIITLLYATLREKGSLRVVSSKLEHSSLQSGFEFLQTQGADVEYASLDGNGVIEISDVEKRISSGRDALFVQWANNETGAIQPIQELSTLATNFGTYFHVDAAQAYGKVPIDLEAIHASSLTITAHKIHGPKGTGVLFSEAPQRLFPFIYGGQQEYKIRGGTHNMLGIVGFGAAVSDRFRNFTVCTEQLKQLRDRFESGIKELIADCRIQSEKANRIPNTSCVTFPGVDGEAFVAWLDANDVFCSQTSACRSRRPEPSAVLTSMGISEKDAYASIRFAVSILNNNQEIDAAIDIVSQGFRKLSS